MQVVQVVQVLQVSTQDRKTARLQDRKTARLQDRKTARPQDRKTKNLKVTIAAGFHLFPFRTEKLSPSAPMVLQ